MQTTINPVEFEFLADLHAAYPKAELHVQDSKGFEVNPEFSMWDKVVAYIPIFDWNGVAALFVEVESVF